MHLGNHVVCMVATTCISRMNCINQLSVKQQIREKNAVEKKGTNHRTLLLILLAGLYSTWAWVEGYSNHSVVCVCMLPLDMRNYKILLS